MWNARSTNLRRSTLRRYNLMRLYTFVREEFLFLSSFRWKRCLARLGLIGLRMFSGGSSPARHSMIPWWVENIVTSFGCYIECNSKHARWWELKWYLRSTSQDSFSCTAPSRRGLGWTNSGASNECTTQCPTLSRTSTFIKGWINHQHHPLLLPLGSTAFLGICLSPKCCC